MKNIYTGEMMWNPVPKWRPVSSFYMFPTEDAADGLLKNLQINVEGISEVCNLQDTIDTDKMKSKNMSSQHHQRQSYQKNYREQSKGRQEHTGRIEFFFAWMEQKKIPEEIEFLNLLYCNCIEIGKLTIFYKLIGSCEKQDYIRNKKHSKRDVFEKKKKTDFVSLKCLFPFFSSRSLQMLQDKMNASMTYIKMIKKNCLQH